MYIHIRRDYYNYYLFLYMLSCHMLYMKVNQLYCITLNSSEIKYFLSTPIYANIHITIFEFRILDWAS